ncbi:MAG TPA: hypothetical protein VGA69_00255 [Nitriliruptorales bacterium]
MTTDERDPRDPLEQRLRQALPTDVPGTTRTRHLAALDASLRRPAPRPGWRHRLATGLAAAATALTPVTVAVAAEGAVPGDALYGVKQVTERVRSVARDEIVLEHRVAELHALLERGTDEDTLIVAVERGVEAALDQPDEPELQERLAGLALEAAGRVRDPSRLALDRLPTRQIGIPQPAPPTDLDPTPDPRPMTTTAPSPRPTPSPTPEPLHTSSPAPTRSPAPTHSPAPTDEPTKDPAARPPPGPIRTERHEVADAGVVFLDVYEDGVRFAGVAVADGWEHRVDRSREPDGVAVGFTDGDRQVVLLARWDGREVHVQVDEAEQRSSDTTSR